MNFTASFYSTGHVSCHTFCAEAKFAVGVDMEVRSRILCTDDAALGQFPLYRLVEEDCGKHRQIVKEKRMHTCRRSVMNDLTPMSDIWHMPGQA